MGVGFWESRQYEVVILTKKKDDLLQGLFYEVKVKKKFERCIRHPESKSYCNLALELLGGACTKRAQKRLVSGQSAYTTNG